ncbi:DUF177 domain-containing protein [Cloacibacillus sp. An23]|uniref:YceD family protein n=1 Tax=Cloacibacillus sp. An23 TaxID=1965591 RepID=UPI000B36AE4C|nr:DUF177 domain-containing protein [Cloacibacillus sp. An23]OUO95026.1 hypothetical protein B5F39_00375 [Cloacibacillus sp. An23]
MPEYLTSAPNNWKCRLVLAAVPRDGSPYEDEFTLPLDRPIDYWDQIYTPLSELKVRVTAFRSEGRVVAEVAVETEVEAPCARCLEPARSRVKGDLRYIFSLRRDEQLREKNEGAQDGDEEIILLDSWEDEIDLAQMVWETFITALPPAILCSPDCRGLCPTCGANLNEGPCSCKTEGGDPRFEVLRKFMENQ